MHMLGVKLTSEQRRITGKWCAENNIGFHKASKEQKAIWKKSGLESQKKSKSKKTFYYWSTPEGRKERASMGGTKSHKTNPHFKFWNSPEGRKKRSSMGAKAHIGKKGMYIPGQNKFIRVAPKDFQAHLDQGYIFGSPHNPWKNRTTGGPSPLRKKVTDSVIIFDSLLLASKHYSVSSATIINWCKSKKKPNWSYVSEI